MIYISKNAYEYINKIILLHEKRKFIELKIKYRKEKLIFQILFIKKLLKNKYSKIEFKDFNLYVKKNKINFVYNLNIDLKKTDFEKKLVFKSDVISKYNSTFNNNIIKKTNLNNSFERQVQDFIQKEINPILYSHGGELCVEKIENEKILFIRFFGNCHGCSMVNNTFQSMIEVRLRNQFPKLKKIIDITNHN